MYIVGILYQEDIQNQLEPEVKQALVFLILN